FAVEVGAARFAEVVHSTRVSRLPPPSLQASCKSSQPALGSGYRHRRLAEIVEGVARLRSQAAVNATGLALVELARQAWTSRQIDLLDQTVRTILALPLDPRAQNVAHYYSAYALGEAGGPVATGAVLNDLVDAALPEHKPRIMVALGNCHLATGDVNTSTKIYLEACRASAELDPLSKCSALRELALVRSFNGDHVG